MRLFTWVKNRWICLRAGHDWDRFVLTSPAGGMVVGKECKRCKATRMAVI